MEIINEWDALRATRYLLNLDWAALTHPKKPEIAISITHLQETQVQLLQFMQARKIAEQPVGDVFYSALKKLVQEASFLTQQLTPEAQEGFFQFLSLSEIT